MPLTRILPQWIVENVLSSLKFYKKLGFKVDYIEDESPLFVFGVN